METDAIKIDFALSAADIEAQTAAAIAEGTRVLDEVGRVDPEKAMRDDVLAPLAALDATFATQLGAIDFLQHVSVHADVRAASVEASKKRNDFAIERSARADVYAALKGLWQRMDASDALAMHHEDLRLIDFLLRDYRHSGLDLDEAKRAELKAMRKAVSELEVEYARNMSEDATVVLFELAELDGCPDAWLSGLERRAVDGAEKVVVTLRYPDVFAVLRHARRRETRMRMDRAFNSRVAAANGPLLKRAVGLRLAAARLLGHATHAAFRLEERMAKRPDAVATFLSDLRARVAPLAQKDLARLDALRREDSSADESEATPAKRSRSDASLGSAQLYSHDAAYYGRLLLEREHGVDHERLRAYFSLPHVVAEMLRMYQEVLGLTFAEVRRDMLSERDQARLFWHEDVTLFRASDCDGLVGFFYMDLFPRDGKYTHAACFPLQPGVHESSEFPQVPVAAIVANFSKPGADAPSLLRHDEVVTLFHELGHAMHEVCARTRHARFHGTSVEWDFVEAPSQMLENWCWEPAVLRRLGVHHATGETIPDADVAALAGSRNHLVGLGTLRQVFLASFDMALHADAALDAEALDVDALYARLRAEVALVPQQDGLSPAASFGHLMGAYDAGYYSYAWAEVFAADMFATCFAPQGALLPELALPGASYRREVLQPGGSRDAMSLLVAFLGRPPNNEAFLRRIGVSAAAKGDDGAGN